VEDLRVNAPFQRLRSSLLLLLQLLVLILAAIALGKPMLQAVEVENETIIILIDQSASMEVGEEGGHSRLDLAKEQAKRVVRNMDDKARAMVIAFCDYAWVVSSFDRDRDALIQKIDSIEPTQSTSRIGEAVTLAEAYAQNIIIGGEEAVTDVAPESTAPPASVFIFTDGRIEDAAQTTIEKFDMKHVQINRVGTRDDNVGILAMQARRQYEKPEILQTTATVRNFGRQPVTLDAVLYVDGRSEDVKTVTLEPTGVAAESAAGAEPAPATIVTIAFDEVEFGGSGVAEVVLKIDDALSADNRAWTVLDPPKRANVLLVADGNFWLEDVLLALPIEVVSMKPAAYEQAEDRQITDGHRSLFDLVIFDRHSTARLPQGNYMFWGAVPIMEGVAAGEPIRDEIIFNWDETHPLLRHVSVEGIKAYQWLRLTLPTEAVSIVDGASSSVMAYWARGASQFLVVAFSFIVKDDAGREIRNTWWYASDDFVVFMQNAVQFLGSGIATLGRRAVAPGEPVSLAAPAEVKQVNVMRPDGKTDELPVDEGRTIHYARTRTVGVYRLEPVTDDRGTFAVNLFNETESHVAPADTLAIGGERVQADSGPIAVQRPAWPYVLVALLVLLLLEWVVYNQRVFV